jgi:hypothetical protein
VVLVVGSFWRGVYGTYFGAERGSGGGLGGDGPEESSGWVVRLSREPVLTIDAPWTRPMEPVGEKRMSRRVVIAVVVCEVIPSSKGRMFKLGLCFKLQLHADIKLLSGKR